MGLQAEHAIGDMDTGLFQSAGPPDVGGLVETGLQLDDDGDLFAVAGGLDEMIDDVGVRRCPIQGHLDGVDLGILRRLADEPDNRGYERLVRVMEQDRAVLADDVEDVVPVLQHDVGDRLVGLLVQFGNTELAELHQVAHPDHHVGLVNVVLLVEAQLGGQHSPMMGVDAGFGLETDDRSEFAFAKLGLDHRDKIIGLFLVPLRVGIAGDPEQLDRRNLHSREKVAEAVSHHVFEHDEMVVGANPQESRDTRPNRNLDPRQRQFGFLRKPQRDQKIHREVGDEGKGVCRVHRQRRNKGKDIIVIMFTNNFLFFFGQADKRANYNVIPAKIIE